MPRVIDQLREHRIAFYDIPRSESIPLFVLRVRRRDSVNRVESHRSYTQFQFWRLRPLGTGQKHPDFLTDVIISPATNAQHRLGVSRNGGLS